MKFLIVCTFALVACCSAFSKTELYLLQTNHAFPAELVNDGLTNDELVEYRASESASNPFEYAPVPLDRVRATSKQYPAFVKPEGFH